MKKSLRNGSIFFLISGLSLFFSGCKAPNAAGQTFPDGSKPAAAVSDAFCLDTYISVTVYTEDTDPAEAKEAADAAVDLCEALERRCFSKTIESSDIGRINQSGGLATEVEPETVELLNDAAYYYELSGGAVDPSIGSVTALWDFHETPAATAENGSRIPSAANISEALKHTGFDRVLLSADSVTLSDPLMRLDPGFIAKGYIAGRMRDALCSRLAVPAAIINLGGNVVLIGQKPGTEDGLYTVGIEKPFGDGEAICTIRVTDCAVVTSGIYERCFTENGILYHHILSASDGMPVNNGLTSVTIVSGDPTMADALSTTCFVLGKEKGLDLIESIDGAEALLIDDQMQLTVSSGFPEYTLCE